MPTTRRLATLLLLTAGAALSVPAWGQAYPAYPAYPSSPAPVAPAAVPPGAALPGGGRTDGSEWDRARAQMIAGQRTGMAQAIARWQQLTASDRFAFQDYAGFLLSYPGFPLEQRLRTYAEKSLDRADFVPDARSLAAYFDRFAPQSSTARGRYAAALAALGRQDARSAAVLAWRGGTLAPSSEASLVALYGRSFSADDQDARMNALLWQGNALSAQAQLAYVTPGTRDGFTARLAMLQGAAPQTIGLPTSDAMLRDTGYVFNRVALARRSGDTYGAVQLLANRLQPRVLPLDAERWVGQLLAVARGADAASAVRIAASAADDFPSGTDLSRASFKLRDDYTSLMWLGGTQALWRMGDTARAASLFYRYGAAAQSPGTRAKGFYWAGRALAQGGDRGGARRYFEQAAQYPEAFYGMLSLERLGRSLPAFDTGPVRAPTEAERRAFAARPLTAAVREVARGADWSTTIQFFREISDQARTEGDHVLVANLARETGRRDLGVILGQAAHADGYADFAALSFPLIPTPPGTDFTMVHALTRQESQFAANAVSHAGARGLMQLMPGTAREQAGKVGLSYSAPSLIGDPAYNIRLGDGYFARMMSYYGGAYPLAVGAYNAGAGNVNKWLRANGDPRTGAIDWVTWIERIPIFETKNYIQRVLENAVVYEAMNPARARYRGDAPLSRFLGKRDPG